MRLSEIFDDSGFFASPEESWEALDKWATEVRALVDRWKKEDSDAARSASIAQFQCGIVSGTITINSDYRPGKEYIEELELYL